MTLKSIWNVARESVKGFIDDDVMSMAAAVAFYTALSFAPLVLLLVTLGGFLGETTQNDLVSVLNQQIGPRAGEITDAVIENASATNERDKPGGWIVSTAILLFTASAVFGQLQSSLNGIWGATAKPSKAWWSWLRRRLLSLGMVIAILFILLVALVLSAVAEVVVPSHNAVAARLGVESVSFIVATLLFAAMFKVLPDVEIAWRNVWLGAAITAALFIVGKFVLSLYVEYANVGEGYGNAAGALIALLVWVYYSCVILFLGAEVTQAVAKVRDEPVQLRPEAEPDRKATDKVEKAPSTQ